MIDNIYITWKLTKCGYKAVGNAADPFLRSNLLGLIHKKKGSASNVLITYGLAKYGFEERGLRNNKGYGYREIERNMH